MSHLTEGFAITDIEAMQRVIETQCPDLELVRKKEFRTYTSAGSTSLLTYVLPGFYQLKLLLQMHSDKLDIQAIFSRAGVPLPAQLVDIEKQPWTEAQHQKLIAIPEFKTAMEKFCRNTRNQDAEYVIRAKAGGMYEIGLIPHPDPTRAGEYAAITDTWESALFSLKGVGGITTDQNGQVVWGPQLRQGYAVCAAERAVARQVADPNSPIYDMTRVTLPDGSIRIEALSR